MFKNDYLSLKNLYIVLYALWLRLQYYARQLNLCLEEHQLNCILASINCHSSLEHIFFLNLGLLPYWQILFLPILSVFVLSLFLQDFRDRIYSAEGSGICQFWSYNRQCAELQSPCICSQTWSIGRSISDWSMLSYSFKMHCMDSVRKYNMARMYLWIKLPLMGVQKKEIGVLMQISEFQKANMHTLTEDLLSIRACRKFDGFLI